MWYLGEETQILNLTVGDVGVLHSVNKHEDIPSLNQHLVIYYDCPFFKDFACHPCFTIVLVYYTKFTDVKTLKTTRLCTFTNNQWFQLLSLDNTQRSLLS